MSAPWHFATLADANGVGREWPVLASDTPGLVVHFSMGDPMWAVTHERSGMSLAFFDTRDEAWRCADALGAAGDWTKSGADIKADADMCAAARRIRIEADPIPTRSHDHPSRSEWAAR